MTDDERDELAAAYLDGACTPAERAQVESDPDLLARVEVQRQVHEALAGPLPEPVDDRRRDASLAAALAVFDEIHPAVPTPAPPATATIPATDPPRPVSLAAERRRREDRRRRVVTVLGVAAAFVAVVGIASQADLGGSGDDDSAEVADAGATVADATDSDATAADALAVEAAEAAPADGETAGAADEAFDAGADTTTAAPAADDGAAVTQESSIAVSDLGSYTDSADLADAYATARSGGPATTVAPTAPVAPSCLAALADQGLVVVATATLSGQPVLVAAADPVGSATVELVDATTCTVTGSVDLPR